MKTALLRVKHNLVLGFLQQGALSMKHAGWQSCLFHRAIWQTADVLHDILGIFQCPRIMMWSSFTSTSHILSSSDRMRLDFFNIYIYLGIGGNLVSIQSSRISTRLHLNYLPGEVPADRRKCYNPCSIFFGSGTTHRHTHTNTLHHHHLTHSILWQDQIIDRLRFCSSWWSLASWFFYILHIWWKEPKQCQVFSWQLPSWLPL